VAGLKPGIGTVPRRYGFPPLNQDLQVIGPMGRCVSDLRAAFAVMAGRRFDGSSPARALRIGVVQAIGDLPVERSVARAFDEACHALGELGHSLQPMNAPWDPADVNGLFSALTSVGTARVVATQTDWRDRVTASVRQAAEAGSARLATEYLADLDRLAAFRWRIRDALGSYDVVATPASSAVAWPRSEPYPKTIAGRDAGPRDAASFSTAINLAGLPAIVVPAPVGTGELPAGLQLIGRMGSEELLLDLAETYDTARPWTRLAPL
jgi:aspartyl-tRNA(Asn)/glutamyl-tRNA(Gln) amidotransferase subunit A